MGVGIGDKMGINVIEFLDVVRLGFLLKNKWFFRYNDK